MARNTPSSSPTFKTIKEITPGDPSVWQPASFQEWKQNQRLDVILDAWTSQADQERTLRTMVARWVFILISCEIVFIFTLLILVGFKMMNLPNDVLDVLIPALFAKIVALGWIVVRYLFSENLRSKFDSLVDMPRDRG
jgi:hypothetical protein